VQAIIGTESDDGFEFDFAHDRIMLDTRTPVGKYQGGGFGPTVIFLSRRKRQDSLGSRPLERPGPPTLTPLDASLMNENCRTLPV
jgi:hypothetical protein